VSTYCLGVTRQSGEICSGSPVNKPPVTISGYGDPPPCDGWDIASRRDAAVKLQINATVRNETATITVALLCIIIVSPLYAQVH